MRILFICTGNICRSPMAEVIARNGGKFTKVSSAGIYAFEGLGMTPTAKKALKKRGFKIGKGFKSTQFSTQMLGNFDTIVCMKESHKEFILRYGEHENIHVWDLDDPFMGSLDTYMNVCTQIEEKIKEVEPDEKNSLGV